MEEQLFNFHFPGPQTPNSMEDQNATNFELVEKDGKKQFRCTIPNCGKIFKFKSEIMRHEVIHLNERPYACSHEGCKKAFKRPDALEIHSRIHTKETPYICEAPGCGLKFTTRSGLRYHLLKHNEQRPFICAFPGCDKSFITPAQLRQHERASNFHEKLAKKQGPEDFVEHNPFAGFNNTNLPTLANISMMPSKCAKGQVNYQDRLYDDFGEATLAPRPAKVFEWQVRNQDEEEKYNKEKKQEDFEKVLKVLVQENKMLKQRLQMCDQLMGVFNENQNLKTELTKQEKEPEKEPSLFFDENEFLFLDFLKQKDNGSF